MAQGQLMSFLELTGDHFQGTRRGLFDALIRANEDMKDNQYDGVVNTFSTAFSKREITDLNLSRLDKAIKWVYGEDEHGAWEAMTHARSFLNRENEKLPEPKKPDNPKGNPGSSQGDDDKKPGGSQGNNPNPPTPFFNDYLELGAVVAPISKGHYKDAESFRQKMEAAVYKERQLTDIDRGLVYEAYCRKAGELGLSQTDVDVQLMEFDIKFDFDDNAPLTLDEIPEAEPQVPGVVVPPEEPTVAAAAAPPTDVSMDVAQALKVLGLEEFSLKAIEAFKRQSEQKAADFVHSVVNHCLNEANITITAEAQEHLRRSWYLSQV